MNTQYEHRWFSRPKIIQTVDKQTQNAKIGLWGADQFISTHSQNASKRFLFKESLHRELSQRLQEIQKFQFYDLIARFPFLVHPAELPAPLIVSLIIQMLGITNQSNFSMSSLQNMNSQVIQDLVYQGLTDSIVHGQVYLSKAMEYWYQVTNAVKINQSTDKQLKSPKGVLGTSFAFIKDKFTGVAEKLAKTFDTIKTAIATGFGALTLWEYLMGIVDVDPQFAQKFAEATAKLRKYGAFLVDGFYIENNAFRNYIGQQIYYSIPSYKELFFRIKGSYIQLFINEEGIMKIVPQINFNELFLKNLLKKRTIRQNAEIIKQYNMISKPVEGYDQSMKKFNATFLNSDEYAKTQTEMKALSKDDQEKYGIVVPKTTQITLRTLDSYIKAKKKKDQKLTQLKIG